MPVTKGRVKRLLVRAGKLEGDAEWAAILGFDGLDTCVISPPGLPVMQDVREATLGLLEMQDAAAKEYKGVVELDGGHIVCHKDELASILAERGWR